MKATRSNLPYLIAAGGGIVLILSLFLSWVGGGSAFELFGTDDIILFVIGLLSAAIAGSLVAGASLPVDWLRPSLLKWLGLIGLTIVLAFLLEAESLDFGIFLSALAAAAILAGGVLSDRPDLAARVADAAGVDDAGARPAARPPAGIGSSSSSSSATPTGTGAGVGSPGAGSSGLGSPGLGSSGGASAGLGSPPGGGAATAAPGAGEAGAGAGATSPGSASAASPGEGGGPPAGWYPDPQGQARLRYWDGAAWTDQTSA